MIGFSLTIGGIFMYIVFRNTKRDDKKDISDSTIRILYSFFLGAILLGMVVLALLKVPEPASGIVLPRKKPLKTMSKLFWSRMQKQLCGKDIVQRLFCCLSPAFHCLSS